MSRLDFTKLAAVSAADTATEPRRIFSALPAKDPKYGYARAVQTEVWEQWHPRRSERDLVIKMNTGGGKTVVGLLMLKSSLNEGVAPVVYVAPDTYLAEQVREEAAGLGIETTHDPKSPRFLTGRAILVINIHKLVNGLSVFGIEGGTKPKIDVGTVLVDDAHACLSTVQDQFTLRVPAAHPAYKSLLDLLSEDLKAQSAPGLRDLLADDHTAVLPVSYWAWADKRDKVLAALHPHRGDDDLKFEWPLVSEVLHLCDVAFALDHLEIRPPCPAIDRIPSLAGAGRRIYMTATLADDSVLVTHFAADPTSIAKPITPKTADDLGDRMILTPLETFPGTTDEAIRDFLVRIAAQRNVVVIVPSRRRADFWRDHAAAVHDASTIQAGVKALRERQIGLVVLINKYDGIDLPGKACHVLALDGLPEAYGPLDRVEATALDDSQAMLVRQIQRIEQGMGRGVRSNDDHCVVLLVGSRLTQRIHAARGQALFSPATRAQLKLSDAVADMLHGRPFTDLADVMDQCLQRDLSWVTASRDALDGITYDVTNSVSAHAAALREAFDQAALGRYSDAAKTVQAATDGVGDVRLRGWLKQRSAAYLHFADQVAAQKLQVSAQSDNKALLKPQVGPGYAPIKATVGQAQRAVAEYADRYASGSELLVGFSAVLDDLTPDLDPTAVSRFEQAMLDLALLLGHEAQRPERDTGEGPDVLWGLGELKFLVIECKSGVTTDFISRHDLAQLSHSMDWFSSKYDASCTATAVMVHKTTGVHKTATPRIGTRVVTFDRLAELTEAVRRYANTIAANDMFKDAAKVAEQLNAHGLNAKAIVARWTLVARK
jgi:hypothetical protein